ncbi:hypothetical protein EW146_g5727 [Bondarzewia mesenterica]|uniref:Uncharacterized protein n=1 Tax=Bondarzewia mesenterica TaxID=1095465 RepID=A0A4S4LR86_9AGAM|nr:hypothetical protein EW146_g5727 [Bondarzewia mesenterica]
MNMAPDVRVNSSIDGASVFTFSILASPNIRDTIFAHSSSATLLRLSRTCLAALSAVRAYSRHAFDITRLLSRYFPDPAAFRALQARTSMVIFGLNALDFFGRARHGHVGAHSELEISVSSDMVEEVGAWLQDVGYVFVPTLSQSDAFEYAVSYMEDEYERREALGEFVGGVAGVHHFIKSTEGLKVRVTAALRSPIEVVLSLQCTCAMNFITHETAYSLYPHATFESRVALVSTSGYDSVNEDDHEHFIARGLTLVFEPPVTDCSYGSFVEDLTAREPSLLAGGRWTDDSLSWALPLSPSPSRDERDLLPQIHQAPAL